MLNFVAAATPEADRSAECRRWLAPGAVVAAVCLGLALQISNGILDSNSLALIAGAFTLIAVTAVAPRPERLARLDFRIVLVVALAALAVHMACLFTALPIIYLKPEQGDLGPFHVRLAILAVAGAAALWPGPRWAKALQIGALVAVHYSIGAWIIHRSPNPAIDVHLFHQYSIAALRSGVDPYTLTFPDIYGNGAYYGPGLSEGGRLQFGFPYFPLSLLLSMPGQIYFKDPRFAQLIAMELSAVLMAFGRRSGLGLIAAVLYLTTPRIFFVLEQSWTEPFLVLGVSALVCASCRRSRLVPWLFGAFIALKQYLVFALPAALFLADPPRNGRRLAIFLTKAAFVGAVLTLPFVVWNPAAFWRSVVTLQFHQPFRPDALSVLAWWVARGHEPPSALLSFVAAAAASAVALWRLPRTPAGFASALGMTFLAFFAFNKQAFCNYYFFVIGTLYASAAAWRPPGADA